MADHLNYKYVCFMDKLEFPILEVFPEIILCSPGKRNWMEGCSFKYSNERQNPNPNR